MPDREGGPQRPVPADWLTLRRGADEAARVAALPLLDGLLSRTSGGELHLVDLGAGTGANQQWLGARLAELGRRGVWSLLDHDPALLEHPGHGPGRRVLAGVEELADLLAADEHPPDARVVTCSALLDLLTADQLELLAAVLVGTGTPGLFSLTVTGAVTLSPAHPLDDAVATAFDRHQRARGQLGPGATAYLVRAVQDRGGRAGTVATPWRLRAPEDAALLRRYLRDRAQVAGEQDPGLAGPAQGWLREREDAVASGRLHAVVGHEDVLVCPDGLSAPRASSA